MGKRIAVNFTYCPFNFQDKKMIYREATIEDIPQIQIVRNSVKENTLSDPSLVTDKDCADFFNGKRKRLGLYDR